MGMEIFECSLNGWLAMGIISTSIPLVAVVLLLAIAALGRYVLTGHWPTRPSVP